MSRVSYFQRYSQKENHATNNTMLLLGHFYQASPFKLERALNSLIGQELAIGLSFEQQVRGQGSVPDALISQNGFRVYVETKRGADLDVSQIQAHLDHISETHVEGKEDILLGLTKTPIIPSQENELLEYAKNKSVVFSAITFSQIVDALKGECSTSDQILVEVLDDYEEFLRSEDLLNDSNRWLAIFPCGQSYGENRDFGIYYTDPKRPVRRVGDLIGIYAQKTVSLIGEVIAVVLSSPAAERPVLEIESGELNEEGLNRIQDMIAATSYYNLSSEPHRFYVTSGFHETSIKKASLNGIQGMRYLDLVELVTSFDLANKHQIEDLAEMLKGTEFS
jgi:hypothetical protein